MTRKYKLESYLFSPTILNFILSTFYFYASFKSFPLIRSIVITSTFPLLPHPIFFYFKNLSLKIHYLYRTIRKILVLLLLYTTNYYMIFINIMLIYSLF